ncbi:NUDIX hydrolase [Breoghania sp.]|uniref:NUDIX hydrolase n=1 Tax=Breoghania sp. TaxID=2065378 RepID=UPI002AA653E6|nr:NUDIX hydrolase [Breoghania sp.]
MSTPASGGSRRFPTHPLPGVSIACCREGRVLLAQRGNPPFEGYWSFPGGLVEVGETLQDAALRELAEETGLIARIGDLIETFDIINRDEIGRVEHHYILSLFMAHAGEGTAIAGDDAAAVVWATPEDFADMALTPGTAERARRALALVSG